MSDEDDEDTPASGGGRREPARPADPDGGSGAARAGGRGCAGAGAILGDGRPQDQRIDQALDGLLTRALAEERFEGRVGETTYLHAGGKLGAARVVVVGLGPRADCKPETVRRAAAAAVRRARDLGARTVAMPLLGTRADARARAQALGEGVLLGLYAFDRYKARKEGERAVEAVTVIAGEGGERAAVREGLRVAQLVAEATSFARDLINEPANSVTATVLAEHAEAMAQAGGLTVQVFDRDACEKMGMGAFLGVNRGSHEPPRFIHLTYRPKGRSARRIALIGKGITFDSGGLDLKTAEGMAWMKVDMSGAAAVLGVMKVAAAARAPGRGPRPGRGDRQHAVRVGAQAGRHPAGGERQDDRDQQHRRRGPAHPRRRDGLCPARDQARRDGGHRDPHRRVLDRARLAVRGSDGQRRRAPDAASSRPASAPGSASGRCR